MSDEVVETAHARFAHIAAGQPQGGRGERQVIGRQPVLRHTVRDEMTDRDQLLLGVGVSGQRQHFEPLA